MASSSRGARCVAAVRRSVTTSGTPGDAGGALEQWRAGGAVDAQLRARLDRPVPRVAVGASIAGWAHACVDVSDGLLADLQHICDSSGVGAEVELDALPASPVLRATFAEEQRLSLQATGGDDYELCFTAPSAARAKIEGIARDAATPITRIGRVVPGREVRALRADGSVWVAPSLGFEHFA